MWYFIGPEFVQNYFLECLGVILEYIKDFPGGSVAKIPPANAGAARDADSMPGLGRSAGKGIGNPL